MSANLLNARITQSELVTQQREDLKSTNLPLSETTQGRKALAEIVVQCFDGLAVYGKQPEQVENTVALFQMVLSGYSENQIIPAFRTFLERNHQMPTPSDIVKIIKRGNKPPLEQGIYIALCQKRERTAFKDGGYHGNGLTVEEEKYIAEYENEFIGANHDR